MRRRNRVVWKLSVPVVAIVTVVVVAAGVTNHIISSRHALTSAREVLRLNTESIVSGLDHLMMEGHNETILELVHDMSEGSSVYHEIRLVSHHDGEIVSNANTALATLTKEDRSCAICHDQEKVTVASAYSLDEVTVGPGGDRILQVVTPIANKAGCRSADCHAHDDAGPIVGFLQAEYSLGEIDAVIRGLGSSFMVTALATILLGTVALWITFERSLAKPIRQMLAGIRAVAKNDLSFRFKTDRNDEFGLVGKSFNNMTARIQAHQDELQETSEYLEGIVENSADIIITVNPNGLIQTINRGGEIALEYAREELMGQRIEVLFAHPAERDAAIARLRDKDNVTNFETSFLTKNGDIRNVLLTLSRLRDREGNPTGTFGISKDVTREKNLQGLLFKAEKEAAIGQAVTSIQHAIKNMLNTLTGGSYLARLGMKKDNTERMTDGLEMIDDGIARIKDLTSTMLSYAKEWKLVLEDRDLAETVRDVCRSLGPRAEEQSIAMSLEIDDGLPPVSYDERLIHMTLMDITTNAMDACWMKDYEDGAAAEIVFRLFTRDEEIVVEVEDNGVGMTEETMEKLFTPLFTTKEEWGTGLGLASSSRIVALHGGEIDVESEPGNGARFRITLPLWSPSANKGA